MPQESVSGFGFGWFFLLSGGVLCFFFLVLGVGFFLGGVLGGGVLVG